MHARWAEVPHGFALFTCTLAAEDAETGYRALVGTSATLRRRKIFRETFGGGELHLHVEPSNSADARARWNAHIHGIVELRVSFSSMRLEPLKAAWTDILARRGRVGSLDVAQRENLLKRRPVKHGEA